ncbi:hypothetical protein MKZ38_002850 [Zalerion maritima]|uniref:Uncharacterized protein n=1 Tax=Zalerion maritima TaxID=339359 RepID=A0AAD5RYI7_9PEZI|nr:hypothetical protein MKZ38_002850 [Zalerion maritima]
MQAAIALEDTRAYKAVEDVEENSRACLPLNLAALWPPVVLHPDPDTSLSKPHLVSSPVADSNTAVNNCGILILGYHGTHRSRNAFSFIALTFAHGPNTTTAANTDEWFLCRSPLPGFDRDKAHRRAELMHAGTIMIDGQPTHRAHTGDVYGIVSRCAGTQGFKTPGSDTSFTRLPYKWPWRLEKVCFRPDQLNWDCEAGLRVPSAGTGSALGNFGEVAGSDKAAHHHTPSVKVRYSASFVAHA